MNQLLTPLHRPRRSLLFMPGSNERALEKAKTLPADVVIFDLEDAVAPEQKELARAQVLTAVNEGDYGFREKVVRINALGSDWGEEDLRAFAHSHVDVILLPKVERKEDVRRVIDIICTEKENNEVPLWCTIETPRGVLAADDIASSGLRVKAFIAGTNDLSRELGIRYTPDRMALLPSLHRIVVSARAHNLQVFDGTFIDIENLKGLEAEAEQGRTLGFDGKTLIHPSQIEPTNRVFSPSKEEITMAKKIVKEYEKAMAEQKAVIAINGKMIEKLHYDHARTNLALAEEIDRRAS